MSCEHATRRDFLRRGSCGLLTLAALGLGDDLMALPVTPIAGEGMGGEVSFAIPASDGVNIDRDSHVIVVRLANRVYAMALSCPHENASVKWVANDHRFQCTKHNSRYTPEGTYTSGRATRNMDRFPVRRDGASILVTLSEVYRSDQNPAAWNAAFVALS